jgi:hypothetical protein
MGPGCNFEVKRNCRTCELGDGMASRALKINKIQVQIIFEK